MRAPVKIVFAALVAASLWAATPGSAAAQAMAAHSGDRAGTWEFSIPVSYSTDATVAGQGGSEVDINEDFGFGFGFGYNVTSNFQVNGALTWNSRSYDATVAGDGLISRYSNTLETSTLMMNAVYYVMNGPLTPFVSGGIGMTFVDTNIQDGPESGTCWWDPWYGYICSSYVPTKTDTALSYSGGAGLRFDLNRQFSVQASYNKTWVDLEKADGTPDFDTWKVDFIFRM